MAFAAAEIVDDFPADQEAEPDEPVRVQAHAVVGLAPVPGKAVQFAEVVVTDRDCGRAPRTRSASAG